MNGALSVTSLSCHIRTHFLLIAVGIVFQGLSGNSSAQLIGNFDFTDGYADSLGNFSDLVPISGTASNVTGMGGTLEAGNYAFTDEDGLQLITNLTFQDFRIEMDVTFSDLTGWDKLIDFNKMDAGLYVSPNDQLQLWPEGSGDSLLAIDTPYTIAIERDVTTSEIRTFIDGALQATASDTGQVRAAGLIPTLTFFVDDSSIGESSAGLVDAIRLYSSSMPSPIDDSPVQLESVDIEINASGGLDTSELVSFTNGRWTQTGVARDVPTLLSANGSTIAIREGGSLTLPNVASYAGSSDSIYADGVGSALSMPGLTSIDGFGVTVDARSGGTIDMPNLTDMPSLISRFDAHGVGSVINLSNALTNDATAGTFQVRAREGGVINWTPVVANRAEFTIESGGQIDLSELTTLTGGSITTDADLTLPKLVTLDESDLTIRGGTMALPSLTAFTASNTAFDARDNGTLDLSSLQTVDLPNSQFFISSSAGSHVDLSALTTISGGFNRKVWLTADGGGTIDVSGITHANDILFNINEGEITIDQLESIKDGQLNLSDGLPRVLANITQFDGSLVRVHQGGSLSLPSLATCADCSFESSGDASVLTLDGLTTIEPSAFSSVTASFGGVITLPSLTDPKGLHRIWVSGEGSTLNLPLIVDRPEGEEIDITVSNNGTLNWNPVSLRNVRIVIETGGQAGLDTLETLVDGSLSIDADVEFPALTTANGSGFTAKNGVMRLPNLTSLSAGGGQARALTARLGGTLDLSSLESIDLTGAGMSIAAGDSSGSGNIDLSSLSTIIAPENGSASIRADFEGSSVELPKLTSLSRVRSINASASGRVNLPSEDVTATNVRIRAWDNGVISAGHLILDEGAILRGTGIVGSVTNRSGTLEFDEDSITITNRFTQAGGETNIPVDKKLLVGGDYANTGFGEGNEFNHRAGFTGEGRIEATSATQSLTGDSVTDGATPTANLDFGNVHIGRPATQPYKIRNDGTSTAIRGAIQTTVNGASLTDAQLSGPGVTASNYGPVAAGIADSMEVTFAPTKVGPMTGQSVYIENNFDNLEGQLLTITGSGYRLANPVAEPTTLDFGMVHVGDVVEPRTLAISNSNPSDGFSELLNARPTATGRAAFAGSDVVGLSPGESDNTSLLIGIDTSAPGIGGTLDLGIESDGVGTSELGITQLEPYLVQITGQVNDFAKPALSSTDASITLKPTDDGYLVDFGTVLLSNGPFSTNLQLLNQVVAPADDLTGSWMLDTGSFSVTGFEDFDALSPGASLEELTISLAAEAEGEFMGSLTLNPRSENETGYSESIDSVVISFQALIQSGIFGDFDKDGQLRAADIDLLSAAIASGENAPVFDVDGSSTLDALDIAFWVTEIKGSFLGDTDLNGNVEFADFLALSKNFGQPGGWADGDFDGDGDIAFADFLALSTNFGAMSEATAAAPEPDGKTALLFAFLGIGILGHARRRR